MRTTPHHLRRTIAAAAGVLLLGACGAGGREAGPGATAVSTTSGVAAAERMSVEDLRERVRAAGAERFVCEIGDVLVLRDGADSFYRSTTDREGQGLEIVTLDFVSYARFTGGIPEDASTARRSVLEKLDGSWGSWGQPDTILLEELPASPEGCMDWVGVEASGIRNMTTGADGSIRFEVTSTQAGDTAAYTGTIGMREDRTPESVLLETEDGPVLSVRLGTAPRELLPESSLRDGRRSPDPVIELTQEEYFALVGG